MFATLGLVSAAASLLDFIANSLILSFLKKIVVDKEMITTNKKILIHILWFTLLFFSPYLDHDSNSNKNQRD